MRRIGCMKDEAFVVLVQKMNNEPHVTRAALNVLLISRNLERVADHATNIAEDVIYLVEGEIVRHSPAAVKVDGPAGETLSTLLRA